MDAKRAFQHLLLPQWTAARAFPAPVLASIERAVGMSEAHHDAELRFAVEAGLPLVALCRGQSARQRAVEVFSQLRVWDTENNSGVLIYVQTIDRKVEIVADRGINARVRQAEWDAICRGMEEYFRRGAFEAGALAAIGEISALLERHFPPRETNPDELSNQPVVL